MFYSYLSCSVSFAVNLGCTGRLEKPYLPRLSQSSAVTEYLVPSVTVVTLRTTFNASKDSRAIVLAYEVHVPSGSVSKLLPMDLPKFNV